MYFCKRSIEQKKESVELILKGGFPGFGSRWWALSAQISFSLFSVTEYMAWQIAERVKIVAAQVFKVDSNLG